MKQHTDLFGNPYLIPIQALTWKPPFGVLMLHEKIETRSWNTLYRGPVLICVSQSGYTPQELAEMCHPAQLKLMEAISKGEPYYNLTGVAIAVGTLYDTRIMRPSDEKDTFVIYRPDLFCHFYKDVKRIEPFDFKGGQKWRTVSDQETLEKIKYV
jgi:hypothetical protein